MKTNPLTTSFVRKASKICLAVAAAIATTAQAATVVWNGPGSGQNAWSNSGYWTGGTPSSGNDIKFYDPGLAATAGDVNNVVDATTTINSLQYGNTNGFHTTQINDAVTLNVTGSTGLTVGTQTAPSGSQQVLATVTGLGGTFNVNNAAASILVDQGTNTSGASGATVRATLDMSGLGAFSANIFRLGVGTATWGGANNAQNATGTLKLAKTNTITTAFLGSAITATPSTPTNSIDIGADNGNPGGVNYLYLGQTNAFSIDSIGVGTLKTTASMLFNTGLSSPVAYFRGTSGASSRVRFWTIGDMSSSGNSSANASGTNDFSGGTVDLLVDTMSLGRDRSGNNTGSNPNIGTFIFNAGTVDVNTLYIGNQFFGNAANSNPNIGFFFVNGANATLKVNTSLVLGNTATSSTAAQKTGGTLQINDGTVQAPSITIGAASVTNTIAMSNGTLIVSATIATPGRALNVLAMTNSTLKLTPIGATNVVVTNLITGGTTNIINIASLAALSSYPTQVVLIKYYAAAGIGGTGFNFGLGSLPPGAAGFVSNNTANSSVDLVITTPPVAPGPKIWNGSMSGDWDILTTANWTDPNAVLPKYQDGDFVRFDDSASALNVNLTTTLSPGSVTVSNATSNYAFSGAGRITGSGALLKQGAATLTIVGDQTFTGGTTISNGVLQLGDGTTGNGSVAGNITNYTSLVLANTTAQSLSAVVTGTGSLTKNGSSVATLTGNSTYSGGTTVSSGTLQLGSGSTSGSVSGTITDNGNVTINHSDSFTLANTITGTGTFTKAGSGTLTINTPNSFSGNFTNSAGISVLGDPQAPGTGAVVYTGGSVQVAPGVTITNNFVNSTSSSDSMMDCSASGTATWSGNILVTSGGQFRPSGIAGTLDLSGNGALSGSFLIVTRGNVEFIGNATFSSSANGCAFGRNSTGNSTFVTIKDNASVSCTGTSVSLGGGQATGGRIELKVQDNGQFSSGTGNFDIHNSTAAAAATTVNLNGGTMAVGGIIKSQTGGTQLSTNNFNGGKLKANKDNASFLPALTGLIANVRAGGARIDDNGFAITIAQPLVHEAALGSSPDGGLVKLGVGTLTLAGANTYTGSTVVSNGTLAIAGTGSINATTNITVNSGATLDVTAAGLTVGAAQTLTGGGSVNGSLTVNGTFAPTGPLTVNNSLILSGTTLMRVSKSGAVLTNDAVVGLSTVQFGGDLIVNDLGPDALQPGDSFQLFNVGGTGSFATITPVLTGGMSWSFDVSTGILSVISSGAPTLNFTSSGSSLQFSWTGSGYKLQAQTNSLSTGLGTNWGDVAGGTSSPVSVTIDPLNPSVFFRLAPTP